MNHKTFLAGLDADAKARLTMRSNSAGLVHLGLYLALLSALVLFVAMRGPLWWAGVPLLGVVWAFLFTLQHECTHQTPFCSMNLNEAVGHACAFVLFQPFLWFRYFHLAHHRHTHDPERDPELLGGGKPGTWRGYVWHVSSLGYWRDKASLLRANAFGPVGASHLPERVRPRLRREARVLLGLYAIAAAGLCAVPGLFWVWPGPLVFGFPVLRLYLLAEHGRCPMVANMFDNTRTTFTNRAVRFLAWNMPYHAEHHVYPGVPFHRLPQFHRLTRAHLRQTERGYARFNAEYMRGLSD